MTRRGLLAASVAAMFAGHGARAGTPAPAPRIPLVRTAVARVPETLDPAESSSLGDLWLDTLALESPNRWNAQGDVVGAFASVTASADGSTVDVVLWPGTMFFDGTPVHADDVRYTIERIRNSPGPMAGGWRAEHIHRLETVDASTVRIVMDRPDASLAASLAHQRFGVIPAGTSGEDVRGGTGPFYLSARGSDSLSYRRNAYFREVGRPPIERIRVEAISDDTRRTTSMATGEIDLLPGVPLLDIPVLQNEPTVYLVGGPSNRVCHVQMNLTMPELRDARVRRMLSHAIDRAGLVEVATAGQGTPTSLLFGEESWAYAGIDELEQRSPDEIRAELRALGIPTDLRLRLLTDNADATLANTAIVLQEHLALSGIALSVALLEGDDLQQAIQLGEYDLLAGYTDPWRDPHELVRPLLASDGDRNHSGYANDHVDNVIRGAILRGSRPFRQERYRIIEEAVRRDVPLVVLFRPHYYDAVSTRITNYSRFPPVTSRGLLSVQPEAGDA